MAINVLISCARKSKEKEIIKQHLKDNPNIGHIYDCNDTPTDYKRETSKQDDIDRHIREVTDWFIFICPFDFLGEATFHELEVAINAQNKKTGLPMISLFFSKDPQTELEICNSQYPLDKKIIQRPEDVSRTQIDKYLNSASFHKNRRYDPDYYKHGELTKCVEKELHCFINHGLRLRRYETACNEVVPSDIFFDCNRTKPENGFSKNVFRRRHHDQDMIEAGYDHILLCGAPASGKSRSVFEYIKSFGYNPNNKFITVRGAQNLTGSGVGHRCISLSRIVEELTYYDAYLERENIYIEAPENQRNFIVIDQIDSMLGDDLSQLEALFHHVSSVRRPSYQILLTTTPSGYDANKELFEKFEQMAFTAKDSIQCSFQLKTIQISCPSYDDAQWVWGQLGNDSLPMPKGNVIGDYIYKLSSYNSRLIDEARHFKSKFSYDVIPVRSHKKTCISNIIAAFVRGVQLVRTMRHKGQLPLCLVLMATKEELWQSIVDKNTSTTGTIAKGYTYLNSTDEAFLKDFAMDVQNLVSQYLIHNNIIALSKETQKIRQIDIDEDGDLAGIWNISIHESQNTGDFESLSSLSFDFQQKREYDHEMMTTIISPDIRMTIINDQVWDLLCDYSQYDFNTYRLANGRITANTDARKEAKRAMNVWYHAFGLENPVNTLSRMISRSPLDKLDRLQGIKYLPNEDNNFSFVWNILCSELRKEASNDIHERERAENIKKDSNFPFLYILLVARMGSVEQIKATIKKKDGTFKPLFMSYDMVGELYGQAFGRAKDSGFLAPLVDDEYCILARELFEELQQSGVKATETDILYYHFRQLQLRSRYNDANEYFRNHHLSELITTIFQKNFEDIEEGDHCRQNCFKIMSAMAGRILADKDFEDWLGKMENCDMSVSYLQLASIIHLSTRGELNCKLQHKLFRNILKKADEAIRIPGSHPVLENVIWQYGVVLICEMLKMVPSFVSAKEILNTAIPWLEKNLVSYNQETRAIWESLALSQCQTYEFNFLLKEIFDSKDGSIKDFWSENDIIREKLLSISPNFSDTWELYKRLYRDTEKARRHKVTPYVFMNMYMNISDNYIELEKETTNRTYERFLQLLEDESIRSMIDSLIDSGEYINQRIFTKIYTTIVTKKQENHFRSLLGESAWQSFCEQEEPSVIRIQKRHIYSIPQVIDILKNTVQRQLNSNGLINDSLFNMAVIRWHEERKENNPHEKDLYTFLHHLVDDNSDYKRRIAKSGRYFKSMHALGFKDVPIIRFNDKNKQPDRKGYWLDEDFKFGRDIRDAMKNVCKQTIPTEEEVDILFDYLELLPDYPQIMPDIKIISFLLRNRLPEKYEKTGREYRDLTPREVLLIAKCVFGYRQLPITTSIINAILEGFANFFLVRQETDNINRETAWADLQLFIKQYAPHVHFDDTTYFQLLRVWPEKLNEFKSEIDKVCHRSERLLNRIMQIHNSHGTSIPNEWHHYYYEIRDIIGQKQKNQT